MGDGIPLDLQIDILCRLPVKSLIRFRSVSKQWKSLIHSSDFNSNYTVRKVQQKRLLITNCDYFIDDNRNQTVDDDDHDDIKRRKTYCWMVDDDDDDILPKHKVCLTYPPSVNLLKVVNHLEFVGSSHGLLCFSGYHSDENDSYDRYVVWNPSIRKSVVIDSLYYNKYGSHAFGVCPNSLDPKIIKINKFRVPFDGRTEEVWRVEVFTLSSGVWRKPLVKLPSKWFNVSLESNSSLAINGFIYWCAFDSIMQLYMIISFDLASEEFMKIQFPDKLDHKCFEIFKLRESVGVAQLKLKYKEQQQQYSIPRSRCMKYYCNVWSMDHVSKSFMKLFTIDLQESRLVRVLEYRANNQLIIETRAIFGRFIEVVAYEPCSEQFKKLEISVDSSPFLTSYTESLLLLNQPHTINDDDDEGDGHIASFGDHES